MNNRNRYIALLLVSLLFGVVLASEYPEDVAEPAEKGRQLSFQCLTQDNQLDCMRDKGFTCEAAGQASRNSYSCYLPIEHGCFRTRFQLTSDGWNGHSNWKPGECEPSHTRAMEPGVRRYFDNINAPESILFRLIVEQIFSDSLEIDKYRMGWLYIEPGAMPDTNYDLISSYFISKYWEIENEIHDAKTELMCKDGEPRYSDSTLYTVFDAFDDLRYGIYAKHLALAKIDFADDDTFDLAAALKGYPGSFSVTVVATSGPIDQVYTAAQRFCTEPFTKTFHSTHQFD